MLLLVFIYLVVKIILLCCWVSGRGQELPCFDQWPLALHTTARLLKSTVIGLGPKPRNYAEWSVLAFLGLNGIACNVGIPVLLGAPARPN